MKLRTYSIIEDITGEYIDTGLSFDCFKNNSIKEKELYKILLDKEINKKDKIQYIYRYLFSCKEINKYFQIKIHTINKDNNIFKRQKIEELNNLVFYLDKIETLANEYSYCIKHNNEPIHNWKELFGVINLTKRERQQKLKKFIEKYKIIAINKVKIGKEEQTRFYLNPFLFKNSDCANDYIIDMFKVCIKSGLNVNKFVVDLLKLKYE